MLYEVNIAFSVITLLILWNSLLITPTIPQQTVNDDKDSCARLMSAISTLSYSRFIDI